jgi:hypothetical protein
MDLKLREAHAQELALLSDDIKALAERILTESGFPDSAARQDSQHLVVICALMSNLVPLLAKGRSKQDRAFMFSAFRGPLLMVEKDDPMWTP